MLPVIAEIWQWQVKLSSSSAPTFTQRFFYLKELWQKNPPATPFFNISLLRKTPIGRTVPHLIVKCGKNHVDTLTEKVSTYLDGTETSVFLGRLLVSKIVTNKVDAVFQAHSDFITSAWCLSLSPAIQTFWQSATWVYKEGNMMRTARMWAKTLIDNDGKQSEMWRERGQHNEDCKDVGRNIDRQRWQQSEMWLLVPANNLNIARRAIIDYKESTRSLCKRITLLKESLKLTLLRSMSRQQQQTTILT